MKRMFSAVMIGLVLASGAQAAEHKVDDAGFIRNWLVLEPVALDPSASEHTEESQKDFFSKEWFSGQANAMPKGGDKVKVEAEERIWEERAADDFALAFEGENQLFLGVAYIIADKDYESITLAIGSDDSSLWLLNGKEVIRVYEGRGIDRDQNKSKPLQLTQGVNTLKFVLINGISPGGVAARFLDKNRKPITALKISLSPPQ